MDAIDIENNFNKALRLLDFGKIERASIVLNEIITEAKVMNNSLFIIRASCVLGELLFSEGRINEARQYLNDVIDTSYENDLVDYEKSVAYDLLNRIKENNI